MMEALMMRITGLKALGMRRVLPFELEFHK